MAADLSDDGLFLHALADGELDAATALALERRIAAEPPLAAAYDEIIAVKAAMRRVGGAIVSDAFRARVAALAEPPAPEAKRAPWARWGNIEWGAMAASFVLAACLASGATYTLTAQRDGGGVEDAIVSGHRRSLLAASPIDVASSDRHTVRPWFDAKLGIAPPTPDLSAQGFPLVGGRVEVVAGRAVPTLVYRHGAHLITVVAIPDGAPPRDPTEELAGGYNLVRWTGGGFRYWALSDIDAPELRTFVEGLRAK